LLQNIAFKTASEIGINYREKSLSIEASTGKFPKHVPQPGDRLPYFEYTDEAGNKLNIQDKLKGKFFCFLIFHDRVEAEIQAAVTTFKEFISIEIIPFTEQTKGLYERFGINKVGYYLIRPDMYIAFRSNEHDAARLMDYLSRVLHSP
jgi:hypothetical protein